MTYFQHLKHQNIQERLSDLPEKPGIYLFKDKSYRILYVGKAKDLRSRLRSYFQKTFSLDSRKTAMLRSVSDFEYTVTENELEAFVLEANLIKQYRPRYNILLRDDKNYPYLKLTVNETWPRLEVARRIQKGGARYFGPYVPSGPMRDILSFIRNNFHIRTCRYSLQKRMRPCIQHQIKRCPAPCAGQADHNEYLTIVNEIRLLLEGKNKRLLESLEKKMQRLSGETQYEDAALVRDCIKAIQKVTESQKVVAQGLGDVDVIGYFRKENALVYKILFSRNGIMIGSRDFHLRDISGETDEYLMKNFIGQFYGKEIIPPPELICSLLPEDSMILSSWLSDKKGLKVNPVRKGFIFSNRVKITVPKRGIKRKLVEMAEENAEILCKSEKGSNKIEVMKEIAVSLKLQKIPENIGAFDVSNISGKESAGAFVYWSDGDFRKEKYRHIKMDAVKGPDDYLMIKEMVRRTLKNAECKMQNAKCRRRLRRSDDTAEVGVPIKASEKVEDREQSHGIIVPDLIIIDGGKGQLEAALQATEGLGIKTDIIGVAKNPDRAFLPSKKSPVSLEDGKSSSLLLKKIRDEAHRFAISYHKKLRSKKVFESPLEKIFGIGKKRRFELLRHFGSIEVIRKTTVEDIARLKGFNRKIAEKLLEGLITQI